MGTSPMGLDPEFVEFASIFNNLLECLQDNNLPAVVVSQIHGMIMGGGSHLDKAADTIRIPAYLSLRGKEDQLSPSVRKGLWSPPPSGSLNPVDYWGKVSPDYVPVALATYKEKAVPLILKLVAFADKKGYPTVIIVQLGDDTSVSAIGTDSETLSQQVGDVVRWLEDYIPEGVWEHGELPSDLKAYLEERDKVRATVDKLLEGYVPTLPGESTDGKEA